MEVTIYRRDGSELWKGEAENVGAAIVALVKSRANLSGADLSGANLSGANLSGANLSGADLYGADLSGADLYGANLYGANLSRANLSGADLSGANLSGANLYGADLSGANLYGANNLGTHDSHKLAIARTRITPEGRLIVWKQCRGIGNDAKVLVKLAIPEDAKRSSAFGRKCRAEFADVLEVVGATEARSTHNAPREIVYRVGERVTCHEWCENWQIECAGGIHFYLTKEEAEAD